MKMGLIGYGSVGKALIKLIYERKLPIEIKYILKSDGGIFNKQGIKLDEIVDKNIKDHSNWIDNLSFSNIIDEEIDCLVELTSTNIKTGEPALSFIKSALIKGINVVTGNKGPILLEYKNLKSIAEKTGAYLGIGCTVGGALPSISCGKYDAAGAKIESIKGVLNGTTNYILNAMKCENKTYEESLEDAEIEGITNVTLEDIKEAVGEGKKIKLVGQAFCNEGEIKVQVKPMKLDESSPLFFVEGKNKGVLYKTDILGDITVIGGASSPRNAAAAILRDIYINEDWG